MDSAMCGASFWAGQVSRFGLNVPPTPLVDIHTPRARFRKLVDLLTYSVLSSQALFFFFAVHAWCIFHQWELSVIVCVQMVR